MKTLRRYSLGLVASGMSAFLAIATLNLFAGDPPVISIAALGTNQFSISITNGVGTNTYQLIWAPALSDPKETWMTLDVGNQGQTNFTIDGGTYPAAFFRVIEGIDADGDGVPDWMDAAPFDPNIGILRIVIDGPLNGSTLN